MVAAETTMEARLAAIMASLSESRALLASSTRGLEVKVREGRVATTTKPMLVQDGVWEQQMTKPSSCSDFSAVQVVGASVPHADAVFASAMPTKCLTKSPARCTDNSHGELVFPAGHATHPTATTSSGAGNYTLQGVGWAGVNRHAGCSTHFLAGSVASAHGVNTEVRGTSLPRFDGTNPRLWRTRCLEYFTRFNIHKCMWVVAASLHMDGKAKEWYEAYRLAQVVGAWAEFIDDVEAHFGAGDFPPSTTILGAAHPGVDVHGGGDISPNVMHTIIESTKPIAASYEEVLTHVGSVSLFLEPCVEPAGMVFSEPRPMEFEDDVFTIVGDLSLFLELDVDSADAILMASNVEEVMRNQERPDGSAPAREYSHDVLTQVGSSSLFLELVTDAADQLFDALLLADVSKSVEAASLSVPCDPTVPHLILRDTYVWKVNYSATHHWDLGVSPEILDVHSLGNLPLFDSYAIGSGLCQPMLLFKPVAAGICLTFSWDLGEHLYVDSSQLYTLAYELLDTGWYAGKVIWFSNNEIFVHPYLVAGGCCTKQWHPGILQFIYTSVSYGIGQFNGYNQTMPIQLIHKWSKIILDKKLCSSDVCTIQNLHIKSLMSDFLMQFFRSISVQHGDKTSNLLKQDILMVSGIRAGVSRPRGGGDCHASEKLDA